MFMYAFKEMHVRDSFYDFKFTAVFVVMLLTQEKSGLGRLGKMQIKTFN